MIWWTTALALANPVLMSAMEGEIARGIEEMRLPDREGPYLIAVEVLDGDVATSYASWGALHMSNHEPYRTARVEVRVGDYAFDSGNFDGSFGERDGTDSRGLPQDDVAVAIAREIWLGMDTAYKGAVEQLSAKEAAREGDDTEYPPDLVAVEALRTEPLPVPPADGEALDRIVARLSSVVDRSCEDSSAIARDWQGVRLLASSEGHKAWLPTGFTIVRVEAIVRTPDGVRLRDARWWVARSADLLPPLEEMEAETREMVAWLTALPEAPIAKDYLGPVLFEGPAAVELFRQLVPPEISGTPPLQQGRDAFAEVTSGQPPTARIGRRLLPEGWSVVDDPGAHLDRAGGYTHDFEGVAAQRVEIVEGGVVRRLLMSRVPRLDVQGSTGHGRSMGTDRREALPAVVTVDPPHQKSMTALRRKGLKLARQAGLDHVLVVRRLEPLEMTEDFHVAFSGEGPLPGLTPPFEAYRLYRDGREEPVRGLQFVGVDRRALRDIAAAGRPGEFVDLMDAGPGSMRYSVGAVGGLPASWSAPPVLVSELELRGTAPAEPRVLPPPPVPEGG